MRCYKLTLRKHADLSGAGGLKSRGRWHGIPRPAIYAASHRSLALLEVVANYRLPVEKLSASFGFQVIEIPDNRFGDPPLVESAENRVIGIATDGRTQVDRYRARTPTQIAGDVWFDAANAVATFVPSVIVSQEYNILVNPLHLDIQNLRSSWESFKVDPRLFEA